jgi:acyl carrier protein
MQEAGESAMNELLRLIRSELDIVYPIEARTPLLSSGIIDSFRFATLLGALELRYGVSIDPANVGADNFDTPSQICAYLGLLP